MKKVFKIIGIIFVVLLVLIGLFVGGFFLYISHQHTKWARHFAEITPQQAQRAVAQMDELEKAVNKYVKEHGINKEKLDFLGDGKSEHYCKDCLDIDLSHLNCGEGNLSSNMCRDEEFAYGATCNAETQKCFVFAGFPPETYKWYLFYPYAPIMYEFEKNCPNEVVGSFWVREVFPEQKNTSLQCTGDPEKNALCTYVKEQGVEREVKEYPTLCEEMAYLKE